MANALSFNTKEIGILTPNRLAQTQLHAGDVGYVITGVKDPQLVRVGDTLTETQHPTNTALPGYAPAQSMVFAGIYPQDDYSALKDAINKLALNDPSLHVANAVSDALGPGFYCGFIGIFHLQIIKERLHDEYGVDVIVTAPNVTYRVTQNNGTGDLLTVTNPQHFPDFNKIEHVEEPRMRIELTTPAALLNDVMRLANQHKGEFVDMANQDDLVVLTYTIPLAEIAYSFFNELKSLTHGYASLSTRFDATHQQMWCELMFRSTTPGLMRSHLSPIEAMLPTKHKNWSISSSTWCRAGCTQCRFRLSLRANPLRGWTFLRCAKTPRSMVSRTVFQKSSNSYDVKIATNVQLLTVILSCRKKCLMQS